MCIRDRASAYFTFYCSKKQLKSYIDKLLPEFSEGINGNIKKQPDKVKIKYIVDYLINSVIVLIVVASIIYYVNPSKVFEMAIVAGSAFILFYMFIAKILSFITCGVFIGDELVGVREGTMGTRYSLIKYCNIQYITINPVSYTHLSIIPVNKTMHPLTVSIASKDNSLSSCISLL